MPWSRNGASEYCFLLSAAFLLRSLILSGLARRTSVASFALSRQHRAVARTRAAPGRHRAVVTITTATNTHLPMSPPASAANNGNKARFVYGKDDALFGAIEKQQGNKPFGSLLDAGTGLHSLRWIATLFETKGLTDFTAVTADETMQTNCQRELDCLDVVTGAKLVKGNWFDEKQPLVLEQQYDVILSDYLIGAMDGFSPYQQDLMIAKLSTYLKPEGRLYIVGLQPIPDTVPSDCLDANAAIICRVRQVRDACILLAGHRCYREYPVDWVHRQIANCPGLELKHTKEFPILYRHATVVKQIDVGRSKLRYMPTVQLQEAMGQILDDLETESLQATTAAPMNRIQMGFDYVVTAEKTP